MDNNDLKDIKIESVDLNNPVQQVITEEKDDKRKVQSKISSESSLYVLMKDFEESTKQSRQRIDELKNKLELLNKREEQLELKVEENDQYLKKLSITVKEDRIDIENCYKNTVENGDRINKIEKKLKKISKKEVKEKKKEDEESLNLSDLDNLDSKNRRVTLFKDTKKATNKEEDDKIQFTAADGLVQFEIQFGKEKVKNDNFMQHKEIDYVFDGKGNKSWKIAEKLLRTLTNLKRRIETWQWDKRTAWRILEIHCTGDASISVSSQCNFADAVTSLLTEYIGREDVFRLRSNLQNFRQEDGESGKSWFYRLYDYSKFLKIVSNVDLYYAFRNCNERWWIMNSKSLLQINADQPLINQLNLIQDTSWSNIKIDHKKSNTKSEKTTNSSETNPKFDIRPEIKKMKKEGRCHNCLEKHRLSGRCDKPKKCLKCKKATDPPHSAENCVNTYVAFGIGVKNTSRFQTETPNVVTKHVQICLVLCQQLTEVTIFLDSLASSNFMSWKKAKELNLEIADSRSHDFITYDGKELGVNGYTQFEVFWGESKKKFQLYTVPTEDVPIVIATQLLGQCEWTWNGETTTKLILEGTNFYSINKDKNIFRPDTIMIQSQVKNSISESENIDEKVIDESFEKYTLNVFDFIENEDVQPKSLEKLPEIIEEKPPIIEEKSDVENKTGVDDVSTNAIQMVLGETFIKHKPIVIRKPVYNENLIVAPLTVKEKRILDEKSDILNVEYDVIPSPIIDHNLIDPFEIVGISIAKNVDLPKDFDVNQYPGIMNAIEPYADRLVYNCDRLCIKVFDPNDPTSFSLKIYIKIQKRREVLFLSHDHPTSGHLGIDKTYSRLSKNFWWPNMKSDVIEYIKQCEVCMRMKRRPNMTSELHPLEPSFIKGRICIDIIGPLPPTEYGNRYILNMTDAATKHITAQPMKDKTAKTAARIFLFFYVLIFGVPHELYSDQGKEFIADILKELCSILGITHTFSSAYHPESNGQIERKNGFLKEVVRTISNSDESNWDIVLPFAVFAINTSIPRGFEKSSFFLTFGIEPLTVLDLVYHYKPKDKTLREWYSCLIKARIVTAFLEEKVRWESKENYDLKNKDGEPEIGQLVLVKFRVPAGHSKKLTERQIGPFKVLSLERGTAKLQNLFCKNDIIVRNVKHLTSYNQKGEEMVLYGDYEPSEIVDEMKIDKQIFYRIRWKGFGEINDSWRVDGEFPNSEQLIKDWKNKSKEQKRSEISNKKKDIMITPLDGPLKQGQIFALEILDHRKKRKTFQFLVSHKEKNVMKQSWYNDGQIVNRDVVREYLNKHNLPNTEGWFDEESK